MTFAKSLWHINSNQSVIQESPLSQGIGHIQLQSVYSLISPGTERTVALGQVPPALNEIMRVPYMEGQFDFPIKYGYSVVARSVEGNNYHLMHPHQNLISVDPDCITEIPADLPLWKACLISNLETALTAYWDGDPQPQEKILLVGFGWIGSLIAGVLKLKGCQDIWVAEASSTRAAQARQYGFRIFNEETPQQEFDLAFHSSATAEGLQTCVDNMNWEGRIVEVSWYGNRMVNINLGENFHYKRLTIQSSQVSRIPKKMQTLWNISTRKSEVLRLLSNPWWDQLKIPVVPFEEAPIIFDQLRKNHPGSLTYLLKY
ncbi:MAG: zinc-binding alcohol dehydrogenase [Saprospiraceae bacterium]|nr:zinc-binding alcohol dehydrogenase [Saprospiraceae bacterium]